MFHSAPSMSSIETKVGSPPIVSLTSALERSRSTCVAERLDLRPLLLGVRLGHARRLVDPPHVHLVREHGFAFVERAGDRRGAERIRRRRKRDVSLAGEQSRCWIQPDPSRARQVHLGPRMQVGEVGGGAARDRRVI